MIKIMVILKTKERRRLRQRSRRRHLPWEISTDFLASGLNALKIKLKQPLERHL